MQRAGPNAPLRFPWRSVKHCVEEALDDGADRLWAVFIKAANLAKIALLRNPFSRTAGRTSSKPTDFSEHSL